MADENLMPLSTEEYDIVEKALWELVKQYPKQEKDPNVIARYDELDAKNSLAVLVLGGGIKKKNVLGGSVNEINFRVAYKSNPTTSDLRINSQAFVGRIMKWLENTRDLPLLTDGRTITNITASVAVPYKDETGQDNSTVYAADAVMEYEVD